MGRSRPACAAVVVAAAALVLAACGAADDTGPARADEPATGVTAAAVEDPVGGRDAAGSDRVVVDDPRAEGAAVLTAALAAAEERPTARTRLVATSESPDGPEVVVTAEGVHRGADAALRISFRGAGVGGADGARVGVDVVLVDGVAYQRFPLLTEQLGTDAEWLAIEVDMLGPAFADVLDAIESADPAAAMAVFEQAGEVRVVGEERIDGTTTTRLAVAVPLRDVLTAKGLDEAVPDGAADRDDVVEYGVWVDSRSRVRRIVGDVDVAGLTFSSVVDVLEYDVDVEIQPPPPELTVGFDELIRGDDGR